jgi:hypothetical protein
MMGTHLFHNIISNKLMAKTIQKPWRDWGMRGSSHRPVMTPPVGISGYNNVKRVEPASISHHNPEPFYVGTGQNL